MVEVLKHRSLAKAFVSWRALPLNEIKIVNVINSKEKIAPYIPNVAQINPPARDSLTRKRRPFEISWIKNRVTIIGTCPNREKSCSLPYVVGDKAKVTDPIKANQLTPLTRFNKRKTTE